MPGPLEALLIVWMCDGDQHLRALVEGSAVEVYSAIFRNHKLDVGARRHHPRARAERWHDAGDALSGPAWLALQNLGIL